MRPSAFALSALFAVLAFVPAASFAASATTSAANEDKKPVKFAEIEKGFYLDAQIGALLLFGPKAQANSGFSPGLTIDVGMGYDISERFSLGLFFMGSNIDTPKGFVSENNMQGDISAFSIGLMGSYAFYGHPDANGLDRFFIDAHLGVGVSLMQPKDIYASIDILARAGVGIEYYTKLRHFSVGMDLDFAYGIKNLGAGLLILPNMKYTF